MRRQRIVDLETRHADVRQALRSILLQTAMQQAPNRGRGGRRQRIEVRFVLESAGNYVRYRLDYAR
jgi:hypothetical protein